MEQNYIQLRDLLSRLEELRTVDEDTGQLEAMLNGEDTYPIPFPAALINLGDTTWSGFSGTLEQQGKATVTIRLAFDCYDDTHSGAEQDDYALERHKLRKTIHQAIHGLQARGTKSRYLRQSSRSFTLPHRIKVYEQEYTFSTME